LRAVFVATQAAAKHMKAGGRIINIGSAMPSVYHSLVAQFTL
jgi:NAD(P)-dependent dehydrogenase (short-subunit alcohol dehydrogenase family)